MNEIVSEQLLSSIGWTLIHSLWQSLVILALVTLCLRWFIKVDAQARYAVACSGMFVCVLLSISTFFYLMPATSASSMRSADFSNASFGVAYYNQVTKQVPGIIDASIPYVVFGWTLGVLIMAIRLLGGAYHIARLRKSAIPVEERWIALVESISRRLAVNCRVSLRVSALIKSPIVIGFVRPMILVPVGMLSGLSTAQIESILLHEIAHIRRHDFIVNAIQVVVETLFFFNPFLLSISRTIKIERECCCDDLVVLEQGNPKAYALALASLAGNNHERVSFSLPLTSGKKQLLTRIKRIMESSGTKNANTTRALAAIIVICAGLISISWLGISQSKPGSQSQPPAKIDSIITDDKKGVASYHRRSVITIDENGVPHEEIVEEFKGDEELRPMLTDPSRNTTLFWHDLNDDVLTSDTIPFPKHLFDEKEWDEFSRAFEEHFRSGLDRLDSSKFLKEFDQVFSMKDWESRFEGLHFPDDVFENLETLEREHLKLERFEEMFENFDQDHLDALEDQFLKRNTFGNYEAELRQELEKDGYLKADEPITSLEWTDDFYKVNGKEVRKSDLPKYRALHDRHFRGRSHSPKAE